MKALILCHPKNLENDLSGHFLGELFKQIQQSYFPDVLFEYHTIDILDIRDKRLGNLHTAHFTDDVWSDKFIKEHKNEYDIVFMPDCGGSWYKDVLENISFKENIEDIINKTMMLVSDNGILYLSKFFEPHKNYIEETYKNATLKKYDAYDMPYFIFTKTKGFSEEKKTEPNSEVVAFINDLKSNGYTMDQIADMLNPSQLMVLFETMDVSGGKKSKKKK